jgi:hypothetical protein
MRKISPDRCGVLPTPGAAKLYLPGLARITAINSCMVLAGTDGCTLTTLGETATMLMGAKSLIGSYGTLENRLGLTTKPVLTTSKVWPSGGEVATTPVAVLLPAPG